MFVDCRTREVSTISIILLTHPTVAHLGAYAHCCKHIPLFSRIPVYATTPVISLGRSLLLDIYTSTPLAAAILPASLFENSTYTLQIDSTQPRPDLLFFAPTAEDITTYFSLINPLKYSQSHQPVPSPFSPPLEGLIITAYRAGYTLGGTIWHIQHGSESVVYAVDWNQARENVLSGAIWLGGASGGGAEIIDQLRRPSALVCSSKGATSTAPTGGWKTRNDTLLQHIRTTIKLGGSVLVPCDSSARVLEIAYLLERAWCTETATDADDSLLKAKLYLASSTCQTTMRYARSMLEWMDESIVRDFEQSAVVDYNGRSRGRDQQNGSKSGQPFDFKFMKMIERQSQLARALATTGPRVFLASDNSLEWGFARDILKNFAMDQRNIVVLTERLPAKPESRALDKTQRLLVVLQELYRSEATKREDTESSVHQCKDDTIETRTHGVAGLTNEELLLYQQYLANLRHRQDTFTTSQEAALGTSADVVDEKSSSSSSSSDESDAEQQGKALNISTAISHSKNKMGLSDAELGVNVLLRRPDVHDYDVRGRKGREKLFPFVIRRRKDDEFGELIRPEEYLRAEEKDEINEQNPISNMRAEDIPLGQKRKWGDGPPESRRRTSASGLKRRKVNGEASSYNDTKGSGAKASEVNVDADDDSEESDYEPEEARLSGPTKAIFGSETLTLKLRIACVDYSGIHDSRSLQMLIPLIRPRKLILVAGTANEVTSLAEDCRGLLGTTDGVAQGGSTTEIFTPAVGAAVDASVDTNSWVVQLGRSLYKDLSWQTFRNISIVTVTGRLEVPARHNGELEQANQKRQKLHNDEAGALVEIGNEVNTDDIPVLASLPAHLTTTARSVTRALHVGDLRLAELRKLMQSNGHTADFKGEGTLLVDGYITVQKLAMGQIVVECGITPEMHARAHEMSFIGLKRKIYEGLAIVAAR